MKFTPKPHQKYCIDELLRSGAPESRGLLLDMGLGKTAISLTAVHSFLYEEFSANKVLVVAPLRVAEDTWTKEAAKWDHLSDLRVSAVLGTQKKRLEALGRDADIYVINKDNLLWLLDPLKSGVKGWPFDLVIVDELSTMKSSSSKRWRAFRRRVPKDCPVWGLTGTFAPKGYPDIWPQVYLLDRGARLGRTLGQFRAKYLYAGAHKGHVVYEWRLKPGAKEQIDHAISDLCMSMRAEDWLELPPVTYNRVVVRMDRAEREKYEKLKADRVLRWQKGTPEDTGEDCKGGVVIGDTAATLANKLLQMAGGAVYDTPDPGAPASVVEIHRRKLDALTELRESAQGQPLLVFYNYKHEADRIKGQHPDAVLISEEKDTAALIDRWNAGDVPVLLCHPASAGHGLNLQAGGHIIVWFSLPWSLELYLQANARLARMGQEHPVIVHIILCEDTLDGRVMDVLEEREAEQDSLLNALKAYVSGKDDKKDDAEEYDWETDFREGA